MNNTYDWKTSMDWIICFTCLCNLKVFNLRDPILSKFLFLFSGFVFSSSCGGFLSMLLDEGKISKKSS